MSQCPLCRPFQHAPLRSRSRAVPAPEELTCPPPTATPSSGGQDHSRPTSTVVCRAARLPRPSLFRECPRVGASCPLSGPQPQEPLICFPIPVILSCRGCDECGVREHMAFGGLTFFAAPSPWRFVQVLVCVDEEYSIPKISAPGLDQQRVRRNSPRVLKADPLLSHPSCFDVRTNRAPPASPPLCRPHISVTLRRVMYGGLCHAGPAGLGNPPEEQPSPRGFDCLCRVVLRHARWLRCVKKRNLGPCLWMSRSVAVPQPQQHVGLRPDARRRQKGKWQHGLSRSEHWHLGGSGRLSRPPSSDGSWESDFGATRSSRRSFGKHTARVCVCHTPVFRGGTALRSPCPCRRPC